MNTTLDALLRVHFQSALQADHRREAMNVNDLLVASGIDSHWIKSLELIPTAMIASAWSKPKLA